MSDNKTNNETSSQTDDNVECWNYAYAQGGEGTRVYGHSSIECLTSIASEREKRYIATHPGCTDAARDMMAERYRFYSGD